MGGETPTKSSLRGAFGDAGRAPERVASSGEEEGEGGGGVRGGDNGEKQGGVYIIYGGIKLGDGGGTCVDGVQGGATGGGDHVVVVVVPVSRPYAMSKL